MIKSELHENIKNLSTLSIKLGLKGYAGNKGAVCSRFDYLDSSICLINCHLAAHKSKVKSRNEHIKSILKQTAFVVDKQEKKIYEHDFVFWIGDFNYRIQGIPSNQLREMIVQQKYQELLQFDQLLSQKTTERLLHGFSEAEILFPPTYKYKKGSSIYR